MTYEYALLRYRHSPSSGERVNIGVVMWVPGQRLLFHRVQAERYRRLSTFFRDAFDGTAYRQSVRHLLSRFEAVNEGLGAKQLDMAKRTPPGALAEILSLLVRDPDSCFQWSSVRSGVANDPEARLDKLYSEFVLRFEETIGRERRDDDAIWSTVESHLRNSRLIAPGKVEADVKVSGSHGYSWTFRTGWRNGTRQVLEPISFDYLDSTNIVEKANTWLGRLQSLSKVSDFQLTAVVAAPGPGNLQKAYKQAIALLKDAQEVRRIVPEDQTQEVITTIERDLRRHHRT